MYALQQRVDEDIRQRAGRDSRHNCIIDENIVPVCAIRFEEYVRGLGTRFYAEGNCDCRVTRPEGPFHKRTNMRVIDIAPSRGRNDDKDLRGV